MTRATSDTPVALRTIALTVKRTRSSSSQDRFTSHRVNDTELPRPEVPSPFASRKLRFGAARTLLVDHALARAAPAQRRCRSLGHRGGDATRHLIRSHHGNSRVLARSHGLPRGAADGRVIVPRTACASTHFRSRRGAPVKSASSRSPFIIARRCIRAGSVAEWRQRATRRSPPVAGHVSSRRLGASESRMQVGTFACARA
jgi:hypothetical protein